MARVLSCNFSHHVNILTHEANKTRCVLKALFNIAQLEVTKKLKEKGNWEHEVSKFWEVLWRNCFFRSAPLSRFSSQTDSRVLFVWRTLMARSLIPLRRRATWCRHPRHLLSKELRDHSHNLSRRVSCCNICRQVYITSLQVTFPRNIANHSLVNCSNFIILNFN